ncbi:MAG: pentapeptide repeat-containing protein [Clostridia bacterium]|nr:pentapeptide repeat-containing protein [Clostridia bacterium]
MGWFNKRSTKSEGSFNGSQNANERLLESLCEIETFKKELEEKKHKIKEYYKKLMDKNYDPLYFLPAGEQGNLFKRLINMHQSGHDVRFENLSCPNIYLADRHSTIYELVNKINLENATIKQSHFVNARFDNITFRNVEFVGDCFYKAHFEDVRFIDCTFRDCDFTSSHGYNVCFENCSQHNTDISKMEVQEIKAKITTKTNAANFNEIFELDEEEYFEL